MEVLNTLFSVPQRTWIDVEESSDIAELVGRGLLLTADDSDLIDREERLAAEWRPAAALYHFSTRVRGADLQLPEDSAEIAAGAEEAAARFVERHGPPPDHFHSVDRSLRVTQLPRVRKAGGLYGALADRRTTRGFDPKRPVTLEQLAILLYEVFGCRGFAAIHPEVVALRKSSPSAGGLHPVEAYPLIREVDGVEPGFYHYRVRDHVLALVAPLEQHAAQTAIGKVTAGQTWLGAAGAVIVLTARFSRSFWKYRRSPTAYATLLMDAGHLSQTFYLVCAEIGLGAFLTNVVDADAIEEGLGLDGQAEGALAVLGCGVPAVARSPFDPEFLPYVPGKTRI